METIFDYNPTDEELKRFGGRKNLEYLKQHGIDPFDNADDANFSLGLLFSMRGEKKRANEYWAKIVDRTLLATLIEDF